jgi:hypothetical protein
MNKDWLLFLAIAALLIAGTGAAVYVGTRGIRNNNPGNIRHGSSQWQGMSSDQTGDSAFVQFDAPEYGIRALTKLLRNYQDRYGLDTIRQIINKYAPPSENDTGAYVASVAGRVGVDPDARINVNNIIVPLVTAIIKHENGIQPYSAQIISTGISLA